ncbi:DUF2961 domain-containing protein [Pontibacter sp. 13R65]|uniref:DUF2961 domain-containing protein n=1 Tax=Pontibacter sp. 13R65 TaxID=3127458 RepID=UPI00301DB7B8
MGRAVNILWLALLLMGCVDSSRQASEQINNEQAGSLKQNKEILYTELVNRLTDLKALSELPEEGEGSAMWASYDRKSKVDAATGAFIEWGANNDGLSPQFIRMEGENMVLAEMEGPGAIVRIWSASPGKGKIKIYIDGNETPVVDLPFIDLFNTASIPAFNYPELVYETAARGFNNYVPISYQRSCKVVAEPDWGQYYQFNYITFPEGTTVGSFEANPSPENAAALATVNNFFKSSFGELSYAVAGTEEQKLTGEIAPSSSKTITLEGSKAIYALKAQVKGADDKRTAEALRKLILSIRWDDEKAPAVWSPLGDFFGTAPGYNLYKTLPMGMTEDAMYSYWYMPFGKSATVTLENNFDQPLQVNLTLSLEDLQGSADQYGRFHAKWHRNILPPEDPARWPDWTMVETEGRGRFLGMSLLVWNPKGGSCKQYGGEGHHWWGEGDEKFFVDGETFPSTFGTGTEDYFGYAWCIPEYFAKAFHSQNYTEENMGYQSMNRWQVIDNVPFQKSFDGYLEKYFPDNWPTQYATVAYWYLNEGGLDPIGPTPVDELYGWETPFEVYREPGVAEGESMQIASNTGGWATNDAFADENLYDQVSGHKILLWHGEPNAENELNTTFKVAKAGRYRVKANLVKVPDGGKFRLALNNQPVKKELNFKSDVTPGKAEVVDLGVFDINAGEQVLKVKWIETKGPERRFLLDYLKLEPVK